ncbi:NUDIX hydrolase [Sphaerisporangium sp. NPDC051017]|uniref:NUDIX hydrolase n=1 Tax=Sphaerisporangium sp. NPDC051017 TaxID=3154636 RepID=UPI0034271CDA
MKVRVTGVVIEDGQILLLDQDTGTGRSWSLPGGKVEPGEPIGDALVREMREETGIDVEVGRLLYVCDHLPGGGTHVVHLTFEVTRVGGSVGAVAEGADTTPIRGVRFVALADLPAIGFSPRFVELAQAGWPGAGSYMGAKSNIGL